MTLPTDKSGQSKTGFKDGEKEVGPFGPVHDQFKGIRVPDHARSGSLEKTEGGDGTDKSVINERVPKGPKF